MDGRQNGWKTEWMEDRAIRRQNERKKKERETERKKREWKDKENIEERTRENERTGKKEKDWKTNSEIKYRKRKLARQKEKEGSKDTKTNKKRVIENILWVSINFLYLFNKHFNVFLFYIKQETLFTKYNLSACL